MSGYNLKKCFCLKSFLTFTNSVDPDEMQHYAVFHLDLHCWRKHSFMALPEYGRLTSCLLGKLLMVVLPFANFFQHILFQNNFFKEHYQ